ncbi:3-isopropylmalate dehydratase large subunit [Azohydromonas sediminis]|uniref:3-isopropylmalate dehydratase large subunit n=1 Tax=Azohydromonas sediminis TaxID=2259674 RepID=UPI000E650F6F|nr:3-isopropylmalate dehydratase large subunit [Azohydromonas sediminis]
MDATRSPQTLAQKLVARAAGRTHVTPGEIVTCRVDLAMFHDSSGPRRLAPMLAELGAPIWDKRKVVLVIDHYLPAHDDESRRIVAIARDWARAQALPHVHDGEGICHVVLPQGGHLRPGMFCVGGDSHSPTGGAFGAYMFGIGATEMLGVVTTGEIWLKVPQTIFMRWIGRLAPGVGAKDMMLAMLGRFGMNGGQYQAVEYCGEAVAALSMAERMTLCNMSAELGAQVGLVAPDATTQAWLREVGVDVADDELARWRSDEDAPGVRHGFDASALAPQVALPHSPANVRGVDDLEPTKVDVAYIGACTGAKLDDLRAAARVLHGRRVAAGVRLMVAPASVKDREAAEREGTMQALLDAGATLLPSACGACAGYGGAIPEGSTVISSTARNFKGRMGAASARVFLGSPYTVAASAVHGRIADARELLA